VYIKHLLFLVKIKNPALVFVFRVNRKLPSGARRSNHASVIAAAATRDGRSPTGSWDVRGLTFFKKNKITFQM
jgi:hypothetical protein